jgi:predicted alpha/beta-hydrolase family hydrolase
MFALAHGAGGDMDHPLLVAFAEGLSDAGISCMRFNFPYSEAGRKSVDSASVLSETWDAAFAKANSQSNVVWVGGKSMGGRYASMMVAGGAPAGGLIFLGYPLHAPGKTDQLRDKHLASITVPMLFIQGTEDRFARWDLLEKTVKSLGEHATLHRIDGGNHSFKVSGRPQPESEIGADLAEVGGKFIFSHS